MLGSLAQAETASLQTPFLVFSILILAALVVGAFSYIQLSNRFYKQKDELRKANAELKKAARWQRKYQRLRKMAQKNEGLTRATKSAMAASRSCLYSVDIGSLKVKFGKNVDEVLGLEPGEAKELGLENFEVYRSYIHPDDVAAVDVPLEPLTDTKTYYVHYYRLVFPAGTRWIKSSGEVIGRGGKPHRVVGFIQDINDQKNLELALKENDVKFRLALTSGEISVFIQDETLTYTWIYDPMLKFEDDAVLGKTDYELGLDESQIDLSVALKRRVLETGKPGVTEMDLASPDGSLRHIRLFAEPYTYPDGRKGIIGTAYNITTLKQAQKALTAAANSLHMEKRISDDASKSLREELGRRNRELTEAKNLQLSMLPRANQNLGRWEVAFMMETSEQVGGDFYDHYPKPAEEGIVMAVGDATGNGIRAGIMGATVKSYFQSNVGRFSIEEIQKTIHEAIGAMNLENMFMALTLLDIGKASFRMVMGGMPPVLLYKAAGKTVEKIHRKSLFLGAPFDTNYTVEERALAPGDVIMVMTDGLPESMDRYGEFLGIDRVAAHLGAMGDLPPSKIVESTRELHRNWYGSGSLKDDVTLAVVKVK